MTSKQSFTVALLSVAQVRTTLGGRKALHQHEHRRLGRGHRVDRVPFGRVEAACCTQGASCHPGASCRAKHPVLCTPSDGPRCEPLTSVAFPGLPARSRKDKILERCAIIGAIIRYLSNLATAPLASTRRRRPSSGAARAWAVARVPCGSTRARVRA